VTLSKGFWLADTCVAQALWEAVMGENPSRFEGVNRPVDGLRDSGQGSIQPQYNPPIDLHFGDLRIG